MKYSLKYDGENFTLVSGIFQCLENIPQNMMGNFPNLYKIFPKVYGGKFHNIFRKFTIFGKYSTSLLGNYPQYLGPRLLRNIPQDMLGKIHKFNVICVTKVLEEIPQNFCYSIQFIIMSLISI